MPKYASREGDDNVRDVMLLFFKVWLSWIILGFICFSQQNRFQIQLTIMKRRKITALGWSCRFEWGSAFCMRLGGRWGWLGDRETFRMVASALQRLARVDRESYFTLGKSSSRTEPPLTGYKSRIHNHAETLQDPTRHYKILQNHTTMLRRLQKLTVSAICSVLHC